MQRQYFHLLVIMPVFLAASVSAAQDQGVRTPSGNQATASSTTQLWKAIATKNSGAAAAALDRGAAVNGTRAGGITPLMAAAALGDSATVGVLLSKGANVNAKTTETEATVLMFTACFGQLEVVRTLLLNGARMDDVDTTHPPLNAFDYAACGLHERTEQQRKGGRAVVEHLKAQGASSKNFADVTAAIIACASMQDCQKMLDKALGESQ